MNIIPRSRRTQGPGSIVSEYERSMVVRDTQSTSQEVPLQETTAMGMQLWNEGVMVQVESADTNEGRIFTQSRG
jgi:hypothetical protein